MWNYRWYRIREIHPGSVIESFIPWVREISPLSSRSSPKTLKEWRDWVAVVPQKAELFRGTIRSNLLLGIEEGLSDEDLWWALETAQAADFVREKKDNLMNQWKPLVEISQVANARVDHCACPFEEGSFLNFGWFNLRLGLFDGSSSLKID